jgi:hypothetical protein
VILNTAEGMYSRGGHRTNAYGVALREMGESYAALQAAQIHGYVKALEPGFDAQCRRILGTLVKLALPEMAGTSKPRKLEPTA